MADVLYFSMQAEVFFLGRARMIFEYCQKAIERAEYKKLDDGTWYAEVPGFKGVWANAKTVEDCRKELISVLEE